MPGSAVVDLLRFPCRAPGGATECSQRQDKGQNKQITCGLGNAVIPAISGKVSVAVSFSDEAILGLGAKDGIKEAASLRGFSQRP